MSVKAQKPPKPRDPSFMGTFRILRVDAVGAVRSYMRFDSRFAGLSYSAAIALLEAGEKTPGRGLEWEVWHFFEVDANFKIEFEMIPAEFEQFRRNKAWCYRFTDVRDDYGRMAVTVHRRAFQGGNDDDGEKDANKIIRADRGDKRGAGGSGRDENRKLPAGDFR